MVLLDQANRTSESNFTSCQKLLSEHLFTGVSAPLSNRTKSLPDPLHYMLHLDACFYSVI